MQRITIITAGLVLAASSGACSPGSASGPADTDDPSMGTAPSGPTDPSDPSGPTDPSDPSDSDDDSSGGDPDGLPDTAPTSIELLTDSGFSDASAIAAAPDGSEFYFLAYDELARPGLFVVDLDGNTEALHIGEPLAYPTDVTVSCDGSQLLVSDLGGASSIDAGEAFDDSGEELLGGVFAFSPEGGAPASVTFSGASRVTGLIVSVDCESLYASGYTDEGAPAVFRAPADGGPASVIHEGAPLSSPTGIHVDENDVAWVMDHHATSDSGAEGILFAIDLDGEVSEVVTGLGMGRHGGVSLAPGGITALIPVSDDLTGSRLLSADTAEGGMAAIDTAQIFEPSGVAAARNAPVMVIAGANSIFLATYE